MKLAVRIALLCLGLAVAGRAVAMNNPSAAVLLREVVVPLGIATLLCGLGDPRVPQRLLAWLNDRSDRRARQIGLTLFLASLGYFTFSAVVCERAFHPTWHDDQMHAVQVQMLAKGYLWHAAHPLAEFFETFHIFVRPVYAPIHFPGTAILNVAGVWLGLNTSVIPLILFSLGCLLIYRVVAQTVDGASGLVAALFLWASATGRMLATMLTSHNAMVFLGVLTLWLFLRWRRSPGVGWSVALGMAVSLAGFTRPVDALAFAIPVGIGVLVETIRRRRADRWGLVACIVVAGLPLAGVQLAFDKHVTGRWLVPPYQAYNDAFHPFTSYASVRPGGPEATPVHVSDLPQKQAYYEKFMLATARDAQARSTVAQFVRQRAPEMLQNTLPGPLLYALVPLGVIGLRSSRRWLVVAPAGLMLALYTPHVFFLPHYPPIVLVSMATLALLGLDTLARMIAPRWPGARTFLMITAVAAALFSCTPMTRLNGVEYTTNTFRVANFVHETLPGQVEAPALVFCRLTGPEYNFHDEPVYNATTAWPDDARIVLVQDLGRHNADLVRYYKNLGQNRHVYELDRNTIKLRKLGTVESIVRGEEARKSATAPATRPQE